ncbi:uncharacterized protein N7473_011041 [Penicillium subrubescens]|uniref:uncharacterized protein n=1 Tax=Penicillium subrubescens TaxID=1316194 RepID=UPI002545604B|nr:uncharacterized protein N7473_011041 [Penicillium subrubescens]KAJ5884155.1 hypothetical protein N7473_011041 [Penicillium subrubescens]
MIEEEHVLKPFPFLLNRFKLTQYLLEPHPSQHETISISISRTPVSGCLATATTDPLNYTKHPRLRGFQHLNRTAALGLIKSRPELSILAEKIARARWFTQAFDTNPNWKFTFFAPNNDAFESYTGAYFDTFETAPNLGREPAESEVALLI